MRTALFAAIAAAVTTVAAHAQSPQPAPGGATSGAPSSGIGDLPVGRVLSESEIRERLQREGYNDVTDIKRQGPSYEAKAVLDGKPVKLTVDAATGSVRSTY